MDKAEETQSPKCESQGLPCFDDVGLFDYVFMRWIKSWIHFVNTEKPDIAELHPLPEADQISYWQPIFSKHISDGILRKEKDEAAIAGSEYTKKAQKSYLNIFLRAMLLTFWKRMVLALILSLLVNLSGLGTSIAIKYVIDILSSNDSPIYMISFGVVVVIAVEAIHSILQQHLVIYMGRFEICMEFSIAITLFQHGLCHRRLYATAVGSAGPFKSCGCIVHHSDKSDQRCSINPLLCPAQRHQNSELPPSMFVYMVHDATRIMFSVNAAIELVVFVFNLVTAMIFIKVNMSFPILLPVLTVVGIVLSMLALEVINGAILKYSLESMDYRISVSSQVMGNLKLTYDMGIEDVTCRAIRDSREDELCVLRARLLLVYLNRVLERSVSVLLYWVFLWVFNGIIVAMDESEYKDYDVNAPISLLFVLFNIASSCGRMPRAFRTLIESFTSFKRVEEFLNRCSANFYLEMIHNEDMNNVKELNLQMESHVVSQDTVVYFSDASLSHINDRSSLFNKESNIEPVFTGLDFELKRGDFKIITGSQGCGKTSFIKSILGEMSLVSGSMAVAPLSTGMPIFYTSQEIWLPADNIRSIITFGYAYNEEVYNEVVRCAELVTDFSAWEDGDLRVISDKGYSLSGGQRVRISLARALYAYMIFSKANETMENNRCCFLMCLDEPFNGLDVSVATAIFNNLFNKDTGLLVRDDIAVVMAMSKMSIEMLLNYWSSMKTIEMQILTVEHSMICESHYGWTGSFKKSGGNMSFTGGDDSWRRHKSFSRLASRKVLLLASEIMHSETNISNHYCYLKQPSRISIMEKSNMANTWTGYCLYLKATGYILFSLFLLTVLCSNTSANLILVALSKWSDTVKLLSVDYSVHGMTVKEILAKELRYYNLITFFSFFTVISAVVLALLLLRISMLGAKYIHDYAIDSIVQRSSAALPVKENLSTLLTFITADIYIIGELIGNSVYETVFALLHFIGKLVTLCYIMPVGVPIALTTFIGLYWLVHRRYITSAKILQRLMLHSNADINAVYNDVISGSSIYRSFKKEHEWIKDIRDRSLGYYQTKFLKCAGIAWATMVSKLCSTVMIAAIILIPLLCNRFLGTELNIARLGIAISLCISMGNGIKAFITNYSKLEIHMCSMLRFENEFLRNDEALTDKFDSMNESILSIFGSQEERDKVDKKRVGDLVKRHKAGFRNFMFRRYRSLLSTLFYKPKIDVLDISAYLPADHTTLSLDNVCVPQPNQTNQDGARYILSDVSAKACAGDVIGIVGRTGAGKSTLLNVLQNVVEGRRGSVLLDGRELNDIPRSILRHIIGVLPQIPFVFKGWTLRRFLDPRMLYTDEEIYDALECCGLVNMVNAITEGKGLDTVLVQEDVKASRKLFVAAPLIPLKCKSRKWGKEKADHGCNKANDATAKTAFSTTQLRQLWFAKLVLYRHSYRMLLIDEPPSNNCAPNQVVDGKAETTEDNWEQSGVGKPIYEIVKLYFTHCITLIISHDKNAIGCFSRFWLLENGVLREESSLLKCFGSNIFGSIYDEN